MKSALSAAIGFLLSMASAFAGVCSKDEILPRYFDPNITTYSESNPVQDSLDSDIVLFGASCGAYLPDKHEWRGPKVKCPIGNILSGKIRNRAKDVQISVYLKQNSFECGQSEGYFRCERIIRMVWTPRNPLWGDRTNPDIENTCIVHVCISPRVSDEIFVQVIRMEKRIATPTND